MTPSPLPVPPLRGLYLITPDEPDTERLLDRVRAVLGHAALLQYRNKTADAAQLLPMIVQPTDAVLVKGSRALALEAIVAALVPGAGAHP